MSGCFARSDSNSMGWKCRKCGKSFRNDDRESAQKPDPEEQDKGSALKNLIQDYESVRRSERSGYLASYEVDLIFAARAESATLHKLVREMVDGLEYMLSSVEPGAYGDDCDGCCGEWTLGGGFTHEDDCTFKPFKELLARAKEIGEGRE